MPTQNHHTNVIRVSAPEWISRDDQPVVWQAICLDCGWESDIMRHSDAMVAEADHLASDDEVDSIVRSEQTRPARKHDRLQALGVIAAITALVISAPKQSDAPSYVACAEEDGSSVGQSFPCFWDASRHGNGTGESYVLTGVAE